MNSKPDTPPQKELQAPPPATAASERLYPDTMGKTAAEYTYDAMKLHQGPYTGKGPPGLLKWIGDAQLAVAPINRMSCAIGITTGMLLGGKLASYVTGFTLDGKEVLKENVPTFLQKMYKIVKNHDPKGLDSRNRWIRYSQAAVYALGGIIGIKLGTTYAYRNVPKRNKDPHYLEDYTARVSMHQGGPWSWMAAFAGIFGSASGLYMLPIPGLNYGIGLAARTTSMQDRNFMIKGMNGMLSGATTPSYLRLKEGMHYLCHYAVGNPAQTPTQIEFLAFTLLGPIFKDQLTPQHIKQFTDAVNAVRDPYWQPGGIPREKKQEALDAMKDVFTGAGLEVLLLDMGLNPGTIAFDKLNGMAGKIGNIGAMKKVHAEQKAYLAALQERLPVYVADGEISQERADWVKAGIEATRQGNPPPTLPAKEAILDNIPLNTKQEQTTVTPLAPESDEQPKNQKSQNFSDNKKAKQNPIAQLIKEAREPGDWSARIHQPADKRDMPIIE